jgi:hypothetical protein
MIKVLGISGRAGAGKDLIADHLISCGLYKEKLPFANYLKSLCGDIFGISYHDLFIDKNAETSVMITSDKLDLLGLEPGPDLKLGGYFTVRQVLQYVGTNLMRRFHPDCWINGTFRKIETDTIISDVRFVNEIEAVHKVDGILLRLTRNPYNMEHESETMLDDYDGFDIVYDNSNETPEETKIGVEREIRKLLKLK